jgi:hypothetical protein
MAKRVSVSRGPGEAALAKMRVPLMQKGTVVHRGGEEELFVIDLGIAGIFVERAQPLDLGELVEVRFRLSRNAIPVVATCRVAWWHPEGGPLVSKALPSGLGLAFTRISEEDQAKIRAELRDQFRRRPRARRFSRQWLDEDPGPG